MRRHQLKRIEAQRNYINFEQTQDKSISIQSGPKTDSELQRELIDSTFNKAEFNQYAPHS